MAVFEAQSETLILDTDLHFHACDIHGQDLEVQLWKEGVAVHGIISLGPSTLTLSLQPGVKWLRLGSASLNLKTSFLAGKQWIAHSE